MFALSARRLQVSIFFFFNDTATTEIYTLSLHDALPILNGTFVSRRGRRPCHGADPRTRFGRSEEHTSELQSQSNLVCRLLLEKKKTEPTLQSPRRTIRSNDRQSRHSDSSGASHLDTARR